MSASIPEPGQVVIVRQRPFVVSDIQTSTLPQPGTVQQPIGRQHLLRLSSVEDHRLGAGARRHLSGEGPTAGIEMV